MCNIFYVRGDQHSTSGIHLYFKKYLNYNAGIRFRAKPVDHKQKVLMTWSPLARYKSSSYLYYRLKRDNLVTPGRATDCMLFLPGTWGGTIHQGHHDSLQSVAVLYSNQKSEVLMKRNLVQDRFGRALIVIVTPM